MFKLNESSRRAPFPRHLLALFVLRIRHLSLPQSPRPKMISPLRISLFFLFISSAIARPYVIFITKENFKDSASSDTGTTSVDPLEWEQFNDPDSRSEDELDPGSWRPIFESSNASETLSGENNSFDSIYLSSMSKLFSAVSSAEISVVEEAVNDIEAAADAGNPHAQSVMGFFYGAGIMRPLSRPKSHLYHQFASDSGNMQSKMVLAYTYQRQEVNILSIAKKRKITTSTVRKKKNVRFRVWGLLIMCSYFCRIITILRIDV